MRKSISTAFFSLVSTLMVLGIVLMGCSEWVLFKNYFARDRYETLDQVVGVTRRTAQYLAQQAALPEGDAVVMEETGLAHLFAVSGLHCAFLVTLLGLLTPGNRRRTLCAVTIPALLFYMVMVGLSPSVVRACIMQIFLLTAPLFRRSSDGLTALAAALGVKCYDSELINETAKASGFAKSFVETHEEHRPGSFLYSLVTGGGVIADEQPFPVQIFQAQSEVIRTIAARESCVIVGRCADYVLRDDPNAVLVNLFVHAPMAARIRRESARTNTTPAEAEKRIRQVDKERAAYYNFFSSKRLSLIHI